jgi:hypothetical protein
MKINLTVAELRRMIRPMSDDAELTLILDRPVDAALLADTDNNGAENGSNDNPTAVARKRSTTAQTAEAVGYVKIGRWTAAQLRGMAIPQQQRDVALFILNNPGATTHGVERGLKMKYKSAQSAIHQLRVRKLIKSQALTA